MRRKAAVRSSPRAVTAGRSARVVVLGAVRTMLGVAPCVAGCGDPGADEDTSVGTEPATSDPSADGPGPTTAMTLTAQREYDRIVAVQNFDAIQPFLTEMIEAPLDLVILDMAP